MLCNVQTRRVASLDLIKFLAICGVLIIHLIGKKDFGGVFWYSQAVPVFMVLMGYNCKATINWKSFGKSYISYLMLFLASLVVAVYVGRPFSIYYIPIGLLPFDGPGSYWILLYFLFVLMSPLLSWLRRSMSLPLFLFLLFLAGWTFDLMFENVWMYWGKVDYIYKVCPLRYVLCFGLGMAIKEKSPLWFIRRLWPFAFLSAIYLYMKNYTPLELPYVFFDNAGWTTGENGFAAFYPAMLVALALHFFRGMEYHRFLFLGRFTYHVFLFQILWFPVFHDLIPGGLPFAVLTFVCCFIGGCLFYKLSNLINEMIFVK